MPSRPIPPCVAPFWGSASRRPQDLAHDDIWLYVEDNVPREVQRRTRVHAPALVLEIVEKLSGVFFWLILVVKSLILGVQCVDRIDDLQRQVDELPWDLTEFYCTCCRGSSPPTNGGHGNFSSWSSLALGQMAYRELTTLQRYLFANHSSLGRGYLQGLHIDGFLDFP